MNSVFWTAIIVCPLTPMIKKSQSVFFEKNDLLLLYYYYYYYYY